MVRPQAAKDLSGCTYSQNIKSLLNFRKAQQPGSVKLLCCGAWTSQEVKGWGCMEGGGALPSICIDSAALFTSNQIHPPPLKAMCPKEGGKNSHNSKKTGLLVKCTGYTCCRYERALVKT